MTVGHVESETSRLLNSVFYGAFRAESFPPRVRCIALRLNASESLLRRSIPRLSFLMTAH